MKYKGQNLMKFCGMQCSLYENQKIQNNQSIKAVNEKQKWQKYEMYVKKVMKLNEDQNNKLNTQVKYSRFNTFKHLLLYAFERK